MKKHKKLLLNILCGVLFIFLYDLWYLIFGDADFSADNGDISLPWFFLLVGSAFTMIGWYAALLFNNRNLLRSALTALLTIVIQCIIITQFGFLPGLNNAKSSGSGGGLLYIIASFLNGGQVLLIVIGLLIANRYHRSDFRKANSKQQR